MKTSRAIMVRQLRRPACRTPWICGPGGKDCSTWPAGQNPPPCRVPARELKFVSLQMDASSATKAGRLKAALNLLEKAADAEASGVYLLPEYTLSPLSATKKPADFQEPVPGPSTEVFAKIADQRKIWIGVGMAEQSADPQRPYNTMIFIGPHGQIQRYRKTHLFEPGVEAPVREKVLYTPGETLDMLNIEGWRIGVMICADGFHPEVPRVLALKGAQVILYPNGRNIVGPEAEYASAANSVVVVVCNYVGTTPTEQATGGSRIIEPPWGSVAAAIKEPKEGWIAKKYVYGEVERMRNYAVPGRAPFIEPSSRRPELYGLITENGFYIDNWQPEDGPP